MDYSKINVVLGAPNSQDKDLFFNWRNDPKIYKWCRQVGEITQYQHNSYWYSVDTSNDKKFWAIRNVNDSGYITVGCAGLTSIDYINSRAEFSLYIGSEHQGKGYGKEALKKLFNIGFKELNLNCIWGETFEGNPALKMFMEMN